MTVVYLVALCNVALASTSFVITYHILARWWDTAVGRNIMGLMASIAALVDSGLINLLLGRPDWMRWVLWSLYVVLGVVIWWRIVLLIKAQHEQAEKSTAQVDAPWGDPPADD